MGKETFSAHGQHPCSPSVPRGGEKGSPKGSFSSVGEKGQGCGSSGWGLSPHLSLVCRYLRCPELKCLCAARQPISTCFFPKSEGSGQVGSAPWFLMKCRHEKPSCGPHCFPIHAITGPAAACRGELRCLQLAWLLLCCLFLFLPHQILQSSPILVQVCKRRSLPGVLGAALNAQQKAACCSLGLQQDTKKS